MTDTMTPAQERMAAVRAARKPRQEPFNGADPAKFDHDNNGSPGGSLPVAEDPNPPGPTGLQKTAANEARAREQKIEALRQAKVARAAEAQGVEIDPIVTVRITKMGHGKVSMGEHVKELGDLTYDTGEMPQFRKSIAEALEARGYAEIQ